MKKIITCLLALLGLSTACGQKNYEDTDVKGFSVIIAEPGTVLLDVRRTAEFLDGHIEGALHIDQGNSDFIEKVKAAIPFSKKVAVYCRSGRRSASAANRLAEKGYKCVNLKGGIIAWEKAGMPVTPKEK